MAVERVATIARYQGMSTDEKPAPADIPAGSTFHCVDTGDELVLFNYIWMLDLRKAAPFKRSLMLQ